MRPALLLLDDALTAQEALCARVKAAGGRMLDARALGPALRLWSRPAALAALQARLRELRCDPDRPDLFFCGSGDFHHVACLLIARAAEAAGGPVTVLHIDNHPDWVTFSNGLHCGSWAARAARLAHVARLVTIGPCSADIDQPARKRADLSAVSEGRIELYPYHAARGAGALELCGRRWPSIASLGEDAFLDVLMTRIATRHVYVTIDKDAFAREDALTNWDQGAMRLEYLSRILARIGATHRLIGADIVGDWSAPRYGPGLFNAALKRAEAFLDQPWKAPAAEAACALNEAVNLKLLDLFAHAADASPFKAAS
ncbi:MAG: arginase family protein [Hyphomonadaceae bacterium]